MFILGLNLVLCHTSQRNRLALCPLMYRTLRIAGGKSWIRCSDQSDIRLDLLRALFLCVSLSKISSQFSQSLKIDVVILPRRRVEQTKAKLIRRTPHSFVRHGRQVYLVHAKTLVSLMTLDIFNEHLVYLAATHSYPTPKSGLSSAHLQFITFWTIASPAPGIDHAAFKFQRIHCQTDVARCARPACP